MHAVVVGHTMRRCILQLNVPPIILNVTQSLLFQKRNNKD